MGEGKKGFDVVLLPDEGDGVASAGGVEKGDTDVGAVWTGTVKLSSLGRVVETSTSSVPWLCTAWGSSSTGLSGSSALGGAPPASQDGGAVPFALPPALTPGRARA